MLEPPLQRGIIVSKEILPGEIRRRWMRMPPTAHCRDGGHRHRWCELLPAGGTPVVPICWHHRPTEVRVERSSSGHISRPCGPTSLSVEKIFGIDLCAASTGVSSAGERGMGCISRLPLRQAGWSPLCRALDATRVPVPFCFGLFVHLFEF